MSTAAEARHAAPLPASLNGVEKVAVLLLALGKGRASKLLKHFDPDELRMLTRSAADLRTIGSSDLETLVEEFAQRFSSGVNFVGTAAEIKNLLAGVMTDEEYAEATGTELPPPPPEPVEMDGSIWERVSKVKLETLQSLLMREHPQTAALVLSKIDSDTAAKAIGLFPAAHRSDLLCRLLDIKKVAPDALRVVEQVLKNELLATSSSASHTGVADILNRMDKTQSEAVLRSLRESRPDDAKAIKSLLFTFEELAVLPAAARNVIFDQVPIERLVLALKGTDPAFQAAILSSIGARSRRMVEAELQGGSTASARDIGDARRGIVDMVLKMIAKGEIEIKPAEEPADAAQ